MTFSSNYVTILIGKFPIQLNRAWAHNHKESVKIEKVIQISNTRDIPLEGWTNVVEALIAYDSGRPSGSRATQDQFHRDIGGSKNGGLALAMAVNVGVRNAQGFVKKLLDDMEVVLKSRDRFFQDFDYDGMGTSFFKTSVEVNVIDRKKELYLLGLNAAYVGDKPEEELAKYLGIERALYSQQVVVQVGSLAGGRCEFDFEAILRKLDGVLDSKKVKGEEVVRVFLDADRWDTPHYQFKTEEGLTVTLGFGRVERRIKVDNKRNETDTWRAHGSILNCELDESFEKEGEKEPATFMITVARLGKGNLNVPIWQPKEKEQVLALANKIAAAFN